MIPGKGRGTGEVLHQRGLVGRRQLEAREDAHAHEFLQQQLARIGHAHTGNALAAAAAVLAPVRRGGQEAAGLAHHRVVGIAGGK